MTPRVLTNGDVLDLAQQAAKQIVPVGDSPVITVYPIPCGGVPAALAMRSYVDFHIVDDPRDADYIVDDLIESGATMARVLGEAAISTQTGRKFISGRGAPKPVVLLDKRSDEWKGQWVVFPWEATAEKGVEDHITRILQFVGEDSQRGGLLETPARVAKAWQFWCKGYGEDPAAILKVFEDGAEGCDEMVVVRDIPLYSHCEHHMAPIFGKATVAYIPDGKIVGLSKINRLVDCFARRLQVQERLTTQIADALMEHLAPKGAGVIINARHLCMESRGVCQQGHSTITSALRGVFKEGTQRAEFLQLAR